MHEPWLAASEQFPVLLLTGPRQVGKTTFLQHICEPERRYVTLDDPVLRSLARTDPALLLERFSPPLLIDEIQYAPELLPYIKMAVDAARRPGMFWLTGSQHFQMMKGLSESLAGRVAIMNLLGFSRRERHRTELSVSPFLPTRESVAEREGSAAAPGLRDVYRDIWRGGFPALIAGPVRDRDLFYASYLQTYLQRDVSDLAQVGDEAAFLRFLKACAARTAQLFSFSDLARDADISANTAKRWLSVLEASLVVRRLESYHTSLTKRLVKRAKLYFLDTGLCAYLTEWSTPETLEAGAMSGAILETFVFTEILKSWSHRGRTPRIYYYRDKDGREIDFLLLVNQTVYPLEVKKSASPSREWTRAFSPLQRLGMKVGDAAIVCFCREPMPLETNALALPVALI